MLKDRIKTLMEVLQVSNETIAGYAGYDPANISRIKSGARIPPAGSPTLLKFTDAVTSYAKEHGKNGLLDQVTGGEPLAEWLCKDYTANSTGQSRAIIPPGAYSSFGSKLDTAMRLAEISNASLGRSANIDPSSISRFRNGQRTPKSNKQLIHAICQILLNRIIALGRGTELAALISLPEEHMEDQEILYTAFFNWLCDYQYDNNRLVRELITVLESFTPMALPDIPEASEIVTRDILSETKSIYTGREGLQRAALRFLGTALHSGASQLFLYSDESMGWIAEDKAYQAQWMSMMAHCIRQGIHINIIHNIDRNIPEMIQAIQSWMPLYLSGMVQSYYHKSLLGSRFSHTVFLCPSSGCIASFSAHTDQADEILYDYHTDTEHIRHYEQIYNTLLASSSPLVTINSLPVPIPIPDNTSDLVYQNVHITVNQFSVTVTQLTAQQISFTFSHPLMIQAFREFVKENAR